MITTEWFAGDGDLTDVHMIRRNVFIKEQGVSEEEEMDGTDMEAIHLLVRDGGTPVATGRVIIMDDKFYIGRVAVLKEHRGKKYGDFMMRLLIRKAYDMGGAEQHLHAQTQARGFYEKLGFKAVSGEYMEANIPHVDMIRYGDVEGTCRI